jgi:hypothetical protein
LLCKDPRARASVAEAERLLRLVATGEESARSRPARTGPVPSPESAGPEAAWGVGSAGTSGSVATIDPACVDAESTSESGSPGADGEAPPVRDPRRRRVVAVAAVAVALAVAALLIGLIASGSPGSNAVLRTPATVPGLGASSPAATGTLGIPAGGATTPTASQVKRSSGPSPVRSGGGVTNLALYKATAESSHTQTYGSVNAIDGNADSYWESANNALPQWVQVDLGAATAISRIVLKLPPTPAWGVRTQTLSVLGSAAGSSFSTIVGSASYTFDWATGNTVTIRFASASPRHVRLNITGTTGWPAGQVSEIEVYAS